MREIRMADRRRKLPWLGERGNQILESALRKIKKVGCQSASRNISDEAFGSLSVRFGLAGDCMILRLIRYLSRSSSEVGSSYVKDFDIESW